MTESDPGGRISRFLAGLRFPTLFVIAACFFIVDLIVPDLVPFADEIALALVTALLATLRRRSPRRPDPPGPTKPTD